MKKMQQHKELFPLAIRIMDLELIWGDVTQIVMKDQKLEVRMIEINPSKRYKKRQFNNNDRYNG